MRNCIIYLIGFIGVGKLTTAREICHQDQSFRLFDNHAANNVIFSLVRDGQKPLPKGAWDSIHQVRAAMYDAIVNVAPRNYNYVLTNALVQDDAGDHWVYKSVQDMAERRGSHFLPVRLLCNEFENKSRIVSPAREAQQKKTTSDGVSAWHRGQVLIPDHPHTMSIDISNSAPADTAAKILARAALICG